MTDCTSCGGCAGGCGGCRSHVLLLTEPERMSELADTLVAEVAATASGKLTKSEVLGYTEMAIARVCNYV